MRDDETNGLELNQLDEEQAPPWNGELDKQVLVEYPSEAAALFAALSNRARQLGHSLQDMCKVLGFSYPYFSQLRSLRLKTCKKSYRKWLVLCLKLLTM